MRETDAKDPTLGQLIESELNAGEDVQAAARRALAFLLACVDGEITDATVGDRIAAARALLEYAARQPDPLADVAGLVSEGDAVAVLSALG